MTGQLARIDASAPGAALALAQAISSSPAVLIHRATTTFASGATTHITRALHQAHRQVLRIHLTGGGCYAARSSILAAALSSGISAETLLADPVGLDRDIALAAGLIPPSGPTPLDEPATGRWRAWVDGDVVGVSVSEPISGTGHRGLAGRALTGARRQAGRARREITRARTNPPVLAPRDSPVGRVPGPDSDRRAQLTLSGEGWKLTAPWRRPLRGSWETLDSLDQGVGKLDHVHALTVSEVPSSPPLDQTRADKLASFATRAIARGTFVVGDLPAAVTRAMPTAVPGVAKGKPGDLAFDLAAVRQRRQVFSVHQSSRPTVSILLATRRPQLLDAITSMIRAQTYRDIEVIVVVHGGDPDSLPAVDAGGIPTQVISASGERSLGYALQRAAEVAQGDLLTKMDDDDHYGPDHIRDLVLARGYSGAPIVGKSSTVIHVEELDATVRRVIGTPEMPVHRVAGGTILIGAEELRSLGGWADVPRAVDSALMKAATAAEAQIYRPHDIGYIYVRHQVEGGHTWSTDAGHFLANAREQWLGLLSHPDFGT